MSGVGSLVTISKNSALIPLPDITPISLWKPASGVTRLRSVVDMAVALY